MSAPDPAVTVLPLPLPLPSQDSATSTTAVVEPTPTPFPTSSSSVTPTPITADEESDAGYESDSASSASTSLASSIRDYAFENGRRYHKFREGSYQFPNDEPEQEREDMKHAMHVNVCEGNLHYAPIGKNPQNILDLGTGTGIWCIDSEFFFANLF